MSQQIVEYRPLSPNKNQAEFFRNCQNPGYSKNMYMGAWGCGKTQGFTQEITDTGVTIFNNRIAIVRKYRADIEGTIWSELFTHINPFLIQDVKQSDLKIILRNLDPRFTTTIECKGMDNVARWGSTFFGQIFIDEANELSKKEFIGLLGRLRHKFTQEQLESMSNFNCPYLNIITDVESGKEKLDVHRFIAAAFNPQPEDHWLYEVCEEKRDPVTSFVRGSTYDNWDNLPDDYKHILETTLDEATKNVYLHGNWGAILTGNPCTPHFDQQKHLFFDPIPRDRRSFVGGWDFGFVHPAFGLWEIVNGVCYKWFEALGHRVYLRQFIEYVKSKIIKQLHPDSEIIHWVDHQAAKQHTDKAEKTSVEIMREFGIQPRHQFTRPRDRAQLMDFLFQNNQCFIHDSCTRSKTTYSGGHHYPEAKSDVVANEPDKSASNPYHNIADSDGYAVMGTLGNLGRDLIPARNQPKRKMWQGLTSAFRGR